MTTASSPQTIYRIDIWSVVKPMKLKRKITYLGPGIRPTAALGTTQYFVFKHNIFVRKPICPDVRFLDYLKVDPLSASFFGLWPSYQIVSAQGSPD